MITHPSNNSGTIPIEEWWLHEGLKFETSSEFGKRLKKLLFVEKRDWWYEFYSLEESRARFEKFTKQSSKIWED